MCAREHALTMEHSNEALERTGHDVRDRPAALRGRAMKEPEAAAQAVAEW